MYDPFNEEPCVICDQVPSDYILLHNSEPLFAWCEKHHEASKIREDCNCIKRETE